MTQGKLPDGVVFNSTPPAPEFAPFTPATAPAEFAPLFAKGFGADNLITNAYRLAYLREARGDTFAIVVNTRPSDERQFGEDIFNTMMQALGSGLTGSAVALYPQYPSPSLPARGP